jgi:hypothetical protein
MTPEEKRRENAAHRVAYMAAKLSEALTAVSVSEAHLTARLAVAARDGVPRAEAEAMTRDLPGINVTAMLDRAYGDPLPRPAQFSAVLTMRDGRTVTVPELPPVPPASSGKVIVKVPCPPDAGNGLVMRVAFENSELGTVFTRDVAYLPVGPGDELRFEVSAEDIEPAALMRLLGTGASLRGSVLTAAVSRLPGQTPRKDPRWTRARTRYPSMR